MRLVKQLIFLMLCSGGTIAAEAQTGSVNGSQTEAVTRPPLPRGPFRISGGVMAGLLLTRVDPVYPPDLKAAGVQGTIELRAVIGKDGSVETLEAITPGPIPLRDAALAAVRQWKYRPYLLNGEPVQVDTVIHVRFQIESPPPGA